MQLTPHKRKQLSEALRKLEKKRALLKKIKEIRKLKQSKSFIHRLWKKWFSK